MGSVGKYFREVKSARVAYDIQVKITMTQNKQTINTDDKAGYPCRPNLWGSLCVVHYGLCIWDGKGGNILYITYSKTRLEYICGSYLESML